MLINGKYIQREKCFFEFILGLKDDLVNNRFLLSGSQVEQANSYKKLFGENMVNKAYENLANETRIARENSKIYLNENGNITTDKTTIKVRNHNFYGE